MFLKSLGQPEVWEWWLSRSAASIHVQAKRRGGMLWERSWDPMRSERAAKKVS